MILQRLIGRWLAALLLLVGSTAAAQAVLHKDLKKDFGAVGNGRTNDQGAFAKAADFFNQRAKTPAGAVRAVLHIPAGVYRVGQPSTSSLGSMLHFINCRNLSILGADSATTEIRYADSLRYGAFDPTTHEVYESPKAFFTEWSWGVGGGTAIMLQDCHNIQVANLTINGNSEHLLVGGHWGDTGIQLGADGLFISNSRHVRLSKLAVHHFGRDGIQVLNRLAKSVDDPAQEDILLENSRFDYNGRQGLSITGANGLRAINCSFSHTGRVIIPALGRPLYSNPGAGVDIEPEGGYVTNIRFENCRFVDNAGQGIVSDRYGNGPPTTKNIVIRNCLVWGVTNWSAWVRQTNFLFENCRIYGAFVTGCALGSAATRFVGCTFEDRPYHGQPAYGQHLVYSNQEARAMRFVKCRFVGTRNYLLLAKPADADSASRFRLQDCLFELDNRELPLGSANLLTNAVFSGRTVFQNGPHHSDSIHTDFLLGSLEKPGSAAVQVEGSMLLAAPGSRFLLQNGLTIDHAAGSKAPGVVVGSGTSVTLRTVPGQVPELYIGPHAQLLVQKGGALEIEPRTKVTIAGQLLVEDGAYFLQDPQAEVTTTGQGMLRVAPGVLRSKRPALPGAVN